MDFFLVFFQLKVNYADFLAGNNEGNQKQMFILSSCCSSYIRNCDEF